MFCGPKTWARVWTQKWGHNTKISSPASKSVVPILAHGVCVLPSAKSALSCDRLHLPLCRVRSEGRQKACRPTAPKMGLRRSASQRNVSKGAGMPVLFCSKHDCHKQCQDMRAASGSVQDPGRNPQHPQISKLTYFRTLQSYTRKGSKTSFCEWQR